MRTSLFYAASGMDLSLRRLGAGLLKHSAPGSGGPPPDSLPVLFLDAWAVIDNANKCRELLGRLRTDPAIVLSDVEEEQLLEVIDDLQSVATLRNVNQHAADMGDIHQAVGQSPVGSLRWAMASEDGAELEVFTAYAGPIPEGNWPGAFDMSELAADANPMGSEVVLTAVHSRKQANQVERDTWTGRAVTPGAIAVGLGATAKRVSMGVSILEDALRRVDLSGNARPANAVIFMKLRRSQEDALHPE